MVFLHHILGCVSCSVNWVADMRRWCMSGQPVKLYEIYVNTSDVSKHKSCGTSSQTCDGDRARVRAHSKGADAPAAGSLGEATKLCAGRKLSSKRKMFGGRHESRNAVEKLSHSMKDLKKRTRWRQWTLDSKRLLLRVNTSSGCKARHGPSSVRDASVRRIRLNFY